MSIHNYSVVDLETTGLSPGGNDRIVEIAIIKMDSQGNIQREYETLINPKRDLGPTYLHKITASMVKNAPSFSDVAGDIFNLLAGTIIVGHNIRFDYTFLEYEFKRLNIILPKFPCLCTLNLVRKLELNISSTKLGCVCEYFNIPNEKEHSAYSDCLATAKLFKILLLKYGVGRKLKTGVKPKEKEQWPKLPSKNIMYKRAHYFYSENENNYLAKLIRQLPIVSDCKNEGEKEYLNLLDEILVDRLISLKEYQQLFEVATYYGFSQDKVVALHSKYLLNLVQIALIDDTITDVERQDLIEVAKLLNIAEENVAKIIQKGRKEANNFQSLIEQKDLTGKSVCFTGTLNSCLQGELITREKAHEIAIEYGLIVKNGVTRSLDFLVVADPETMSGKAIKARRYNVKILAEQAFWDLLGVQIS